MKKLTARKSQALYFVLAIVLFVLGSGAPLEGGGVIDRAFFTLFGF